MEDAIRTGRTPLLPGGRLVAPKPGEGGSSRACRAGAPRRRESPLFGPRSARLSDEKPACWHRLFAVSQLLLRSLCSLCFCHRILRLNQPPISACPANGKCLSLSILHHESRGSCQVLWTQFPWSCQPQLTGAQHVTNAGTPPEFVHFRPGNLPLIPFVPLIPTNASTLCSAPCRRWNPVGLCPENGPDGGTNSSFFPPTLGPRTHAPRRLRPRPAHKECAGRHGALLLDWGDVGAKPQGAS
jgi:hypothetical protein